MVGGTTKQSFDSSHATTGFPLLSLTQIPVGCSHCEEARRRNLIVVIKARYKLNYKYCSRQHKIQQQILLVNFF